MLLIYTSIYVHIAMQLPCIELYLFEILNHNIQRNDASLDDANSLEKHSRNTQEALKFICILSPKVVTLTCWENQLLQ